MVRIYSSNLFRSWSLKLPYKFSELTMFLINSHHLLPLRRNGSDNARVRPDAFSVQVVSDDSRNTVRQRLRFGYPAKRKRKFAGMAFKTHHSREWKTYNQFIILVGA